MTRRYVGPWLGGGCPVNVRPTPLGPYPAAEKIGSHDDLTHATVLTNVRSHRKHQPAIGPGPDVTNAELNVNSGREPRRR